uniref:Uncharacterized protein n=1 Tax=Oryza sativa subsp. japonica TaxID=39947 RepID=Q67VA8_ORYSJ|nr:hypothetical protein [Oryza sativa Japonica Group]BAD37911.1 hypothetical protein [Oryza sativa Japonica Group]
MDSKANVQGIRPTNPAWISLSAGHGVTASCHATWVHGSSALIRGGVGDFYCDKLASSY